MLDRLPLDRGDRIVEVDEPGAASDPLDRHAAKASPKIFENLVLESIERRKVDMAAFGLDHVIASASLEQLGHAKARSGPDDAGHAFGRKRPFRTAQMVEILESV